MNGCRFFNHARALLTGMLLIAACCCGPTDSLTHAQSTSNVVTDLVRELKSDQFEVRQAATVKLFELGPGILSDLEGIERSASLEQNQRVENLKVVFRAIRTGQSSGVARRAWLDFRDASFETRNLILEKLLSLEEYETHFTLLQQLQPQQVREVFEDNNFYYSQVIGLCRNERWNKLGRLLSMPLMWKYQPVLCARFHLLMGSLEQQVAQLRKRLDDRVDGKKIDGYDTDLKTLIGLLAFLRQDETARRYVARISQDTLRLDTDNRLLLKIGDWKTLAQRAVLLQSEFNDAQPHRACSHADFVLLKQYGQGVDAAKKAVEMFEATREDSDTFDPATNSICNLLIGDWEKAKPEARLKPDDELSLKLLYPVLNRPGDMTELTGAGETMESRAQWILERREEIGQKIEKLAKVKGRLAQNQVKEIIAQISHVLVVCQLWQDLGQDAETVLYLRELYLQLHDVGQLANVRSKVMQVICELQRPEFTWEFLEGAGYRDLQLSALAGNQAIFGEKKAALAQFLNSALAQSVKDPLERLKRISFLLNSNLKPTDPEAVKKLYPDGFDLDTELSHVAHESTASSCWQISLIYQHHQRYREARQWQELAALKGNAAAIFSLAEDALTDGQYVRAAQMFDAHFSRSSQAYSLGMSSHAWNMAGEEQRGRRHMFYASVLPSYYGTPMYDFYRQFTKDERGRLICELERLDYCVGDSEGLALLENAMNSWHKVDPVISANFGKRLFLHLTTGFGHLSHYYLARYFKTSRTHDLMAKIEQGDFEQAKAIFDQVNRFSPGSPSLIEVIVPRLDQLGQHGLADYMTQQAAVFFEDTLIRYPHSANNRNNYAWLLACANRRKDSSLRHAEMALKLRPDQATYIDTLAECRFARGEFEQAIEVIRKAIALEPDRRYYRDQLKKYQDALAR